MADSLLFSTVSVLLAIVLHSSTAAQQHPLPLDMVAKFEEQSTFTEEFRLPLITQAPDDYVIGRAWFANSPTAAKRVTIDWQFKAAGAVEQRSSQLVDVSFAPTAVARRAGTSNTLYIVGWSDRTGRVIVERWDLESGALGSAVPMGGGTPVSTMLQPQIVRSIEWISDTGTLAPIWDAVCQVYANALLLLTSGAPTRIISLDLSSRTTTELYSAATAGLSGLQGHRMFSVGKHSIGGFIAFTEPRKPWETVMQYVQLHDYFVMRDSNFDGVTDSTAFVDYETFYALYPAPWNMKYSEP